MAFENPAHICRPLLVSIQPQIDECLMSILVRAASANVLRRTSSILNLISVTKCTPEFLPFVGEAEIVQKVAYVLSLPDGEIQHRMHLAARSSTLNDQVNWFGTRLLRKNIEAKKRRISPSSLKADVYHRAHWLLRSLPFCPQSFEYLIDSCPRCRHSLRWLKTTSVDHCSTCNTALTNLEPSPAVPTDLRPEASKIAALIDPREARRTAILDDLPYPFCNWEAGEVFDAVVEASSFFSVQTAVVGDDDCQIEADREMRRLAKGWHFIADWPQSLHSLVQQAATASPIALHEKLGEIGRYYRSGRIETPFRALVKSHVGKFLREAGAPIKKNQFSSDEGAVKSNLLDGKHAMKITGASQRMMNKLKQSSTCCASKVTRAIHLFDEARVSKALNDYRKATGELECAEVLGVPAYTISSFIQAGHIQMQKNPDAALLSDRLLIAAGSLDGLVSKVNRLPVTEGAGRKIYLREALFGVVSPDTWAEIFTAILDGRIRVLGRTNRGRLTSRLIVSEEDIEHVKQINLHNYIPDVEISCIQAALSLGFNSAIMSGAIRLGLMTGRVKGKSVLVNLRHVSEFNKTYILPSEITRKHGVSPQAFAKKFRKMGFESAGKAYTSNYWPRADVEKFFEP